MLDKSVPYYPVIMICTNPVSPSVSLPPGVHLKYWEPGMEDDWCHIQVDSGQCQSVESAMRIFKDEFAPHESDLRHRMLFLVNVNGEIVGSGTAWFGDDLGRPLGRIHWLGCLRKVQGKGLGKALFCAVMARCCELHPDGIYLTTQTISYPAINIYLQHGFIPYTGPMPNNGTNWDNRRAWSIINDKIQQYTVARLSFEEM